MILVARTASPAETRTLAAGLAAFAQPGDVLLLSGDLGAGKTCFAQGFARGLGIDDPVTSPTFTLVRTYPGRIELVHADVYRLDHLQEVVDLALPELVEGRGVALVEWGDAAAPALAPDALEVVLGFGDGDDDRVVRIAGGGSSWRERLATLATRDQWSAAS